MAAQWSNEALYKHFEALFGELRSHVDQWFSSLTSTMNQRFEASADAAKMALAAAKEATDKAEAAMNMRLEGMNEFRAQLKDQTSTFIPRAECEALIGKVADAGLTHARAVDAKVADLRAYVDRQAGQGAGLSLAWKMGIGLAGLLLTVITIVSLVHEFMG